MGSTGEGTSGGFKHRMRPAVLQPGPTAPGCEIQSQKNPLCSEGNS